MTAHATQDTSIPADRGLTLASLRPGERGRVCDVALPSGSPASRHPHGHDDGIVIRLLELGFVPDEIVRVTALGPGGREPIAVQVGGTLFALRRHEAEHVRVERLP